MTDSSAVLVDGPWRHLFVAANGARFHLAVAGHGPLVLLLHGFPEFWWTWREQIPRLAEAGYRVAALDLRGFGASDKPPGGHDPLTVCDDVAAVIRSLGADGAVVVGHGLGGSIAWSMPGLHPRVTKGVASLGMPHPSVFRAASWRLRRQRRANSYIRAMQTPFAPERAVRGTGSVSRHLRAWSGPDRSWLTPEVATRCEEMMSLPFAAQAATEYYRWMVRSRVTPNGWRYMHKVRQPITVPVLALHGQADPAVLPSLANDSARYVRGPLQLVTVPGAGHFVHEERPEVVTETLLAWLPTVVPPAR